MQHPSFLAGITVRMDKLQALAPNLVPVLSTSPVAVTVRDETCFYLIGPAMLESLLAGTTPVIHDLLEPPKGMVELARQEPLFHQVAEKLLVVETQRVTRGDYSPESLNILRNRLKLHVLPALGHLHISQVQADEIQILMDRLVQAESSPTTIAQYLVIVRKILTMALHRKWIREIPLIPKIKINNKPRAAFTLSEYKKLLRTSKRLLREEALAPTVKQRNSGRERFWITPRDRVLSQDMYWLLIFMVNSFVRPTDIKVMRHSHVETVRGQHDYLRLTLPSTKKHDKPIVTMRPSVRIYAAMLSHQTAQGGGRPDDYVFLPHVSNRDHALAVFNFWLKWIMREAGLPLVDAHGQPRTLYSLRHTAITFRLLYGQGIDMLTLARNARTSVDMIETFYASTLSGEMNVSMLQSRREVRK
jgi:hypothetical protein